MSDHCLSAERATSKPWSKPGGIFARIDRDRANLLLFATLFVIALLPVLATPIPAMVDYVNHLARMYVLAADGTSNASHFYRVTWTIYPNLAMDLVVPQLARVMSVEAATRLFLLISQILVVSGTVAIEQVVKRRFAYAGYAALMMLYSVPFAWGFVNFEFALGLALWGIACWLAFREKSWSLRVLAHTIFVVLLFAAHLFALGLYGFALGLYELWRVRAGLTPFRAFVATMMMMAAPALALVGVMNATGGSVGQSGNVWFFAMKPFWLVAILNGYSVTLSAVCMTVLGIFVHKLHHRGAIRFERPGLWILTGFGLLYCAIPDRMLDTAFVDLRVIVAAALIVPAFVTVSFPSDRWRVAMAGIAAAIVLANVAMAGAASVSYRRTYDAMIASFARIEKGSRVLVAHSGDSEDPPLRDLFDYPIYHAPTLAVHYADAFVPTLYATPGKQPLTVRAEDRRLSAAWTGPVPIKILARIAEGPLLPGAPDFIRTWAKDFDYVYVVGPPTENRMQKVLQPVWRDPRFTLYRVIRSN